jgi:hypothetical protein
VRWHARILTKIMEIPIDFSSESVDKSELILCDLRELGVLRRKEQSARAGEAPGTRSAANMQAEAKARRNQREFCDPC